MSNKQLELFKTQIKGANSIKERNKFLAENTIMSDFKFIIGAEKRQVPGHKHIFASTSYEFFNLFYLSSPNNREIHLPEIKYEAFKEFIQYVYSDDINIIGGNFFDILNLSLRYDIEHLTNLCLNKLPKIVLDDNSFAACFMESFEVWNKDKVCDIFLKIIGIRPLDYINEKNVEKLKIEHLSVILESNETETIEMDYFKLAMMWAVKQCISLKIKPFPMKKRTVLEKLFLLIRFPTMSLDEFQECSSNQNGLFTNEEIIQIVVFIQKKGETSDFVSEKRKNKLDEMISFYIVTPSGKELINFRIKDSVLEIKKNFVLMEGRNISINQIDVLFNGTILEDSQTIEECNIHPGVSVYLHQKRNLSSNNEKWRLYIEIPSHPLWNIRCEPYDSIRILKGAITSSAIRIDNKHLTYRNINLYFNGKFLNENGKLKDHNITNGSTIQIQLVPEKYQFEAKNNTGLY